MRPAEHRAAASPLDFRVLDALRGLAALYVVVNHSRGWLFAGGAQYAELVPRAHWGVDDYAFLAGAQLTRLGTEFVIVFFVLSGLSITHSLSRSRGLRGFYLRRIVRLYPPFLVGLAWAASVFVATRALRPDFYSCDYDTQVFRGLCGSRDFLSAEVVLKNLVYLPDGAMLSQYWSLTHEVLFYALVPLYLLRRRLYLLVSATVYAAGWFVDGFALQAGHGIVGDHLLAYNAYFAAGVLLHTCWAGASRRLALPLWLVAVTCVGAFLLMTALNAYAGAATKVTALLALTATVLLVVNGHAHEVHVRWLEVVGRFSYTLYVTHLATVLLCLALLHELTPLEPPHVLQPWVWVGAVPVCVAVGWVLYFAAERWSKQLLRLLRARSSAGVRAAVTAEASTAP